MKGGSTARTFGVSLQEMVGHITAIGVATRESGNVVGNSLKTIYSRLTTMTPAIDALASIGISIKDSNGNMKSATVIIDEMAKKWNTLTSETQQNVAVAVAGRYQLSRLLALLNNYQMGLDATETALNSEGSAMRENAEYMKSLEARIERMKAAWQEMALTLGDAVITDTLINLISFATSAGNSLSWLVDKVGALPVVLGALGTVLAMTNKNFRTLTVAVMTLGRGFQALGVSAAVAKAAISGLLASTGVGLLFAVLGFAVEKLIGAWSKYNDEQNKIKENNDKSINSLRNNSEHVEELINKYTKLSSVTKLTKEKEEELLQVQNELAQLIPSFISFTDEKGQSHLKSAEAIELEVQKLKELMDLEDIRNERNFENDSKSFFDDIFKSKQEIKRDQRKLSNWDSISWGRKNSIKYKDGDIELQEKIIKNEYKIAEAYEEATAKLIDSNNKMLAKKGIVEKLTKEDQKYIEEIAKIGVENLKSAKSSNEASESYLKLANKIGNTSSEIAKLREKAGSLGDAFSFNELKGLTEEQLQLLSNLQQKNLQTEQSWLNQSQALMEVGFSQKDVIKIIEYGIGVINNNRVALDSVTKQQDEYNLSLIEGADSEENFKEKIEDSTKELIELNNILYDTNEGKKITSEQMMDLISKYPELIDNISKESDGWKINADVLNDLRQKRIDDQIAAIEAQNAITNDQYNNLQSRLIMYGIEIDQIKDLEDARRQAAKIAGNPTLLSKPNMRSKESFYEENFNNQFGSKYLFGDVKDIALQQYIKQEEEKYAQYQKIVRDYEEYVEVKNRTEENLKRLELARQMLSDPHYGVPSSKTKPKEKKSKSPYIDKELNLLPHFKQQIEDATSQLEILDEKIQDTKRQMDYANDEGDLFGKIQLEKDLNNLLDERKNKYHEIAQSLRSMRDNEIIPQFDLKFSNFRQGRGFEEISQVEIQQYLDSLETQINDLTNKIGHTEADSVKASLQKQLEALKGDKDLFSYYVGIIEETNKSIDDLSNKWHDDHKNKLNALKNVFSDTLNVIRNQTSKSLDEIDEKINESNRTLKQYDSTSQKYRDELEKQNELLKQKQQIVHAEAEALREQLRTQELTSDQIETLNSRIKELSNSWWEYNSAIENTNLNKINSIIEESANRVKKYDDNLKISNERLKLLEEGTKGYSDELSRQIYILKEKLNAEEEHEKVIRNQMQNIDLTEEQWNNLNQQLKQSIITQMEIATAMKDTNRTLKNQIEKLADDVISLYKEMYQKQKEIAINAIEDELKTLEKAHNQKMKMIDAEMSKYEEQVQAMTKTIDDQADEENYNKNLNKLIKERDELQSKIDVKKLNNSKEAQAELAELQKQLSEKSEEIEDFKSARSREERKKNLQRQLEDKRKNIDKEKEISDQAFQKDKERLDQLKTYTEKHYENLLNDEREFARIREEIMNGNINGIMAQFNKFRVFILNNSEEIGSSISNNLLDSIDRLSSNLSEASHNLNREFTNIANNLDNTLLKKLDEIIEKFKKIRSFDYNNQNPLQPNENTQLYNPVGNEISIIDQMKKNSELWHHFPENRERYERKNQELGSQIGATYDSSEGTWYKNKLPLYHDGGIVGGKSNSPVIERLHKILNLGSDEQLSILKNGELVVKNNPLANLSSRIANSFKSFDISKIFSSIKNNNKIPSNHIEINIDKVIGDRKGAEDVSKTIIKTLSAKGVI